MISPMSIGRLVEVAQMQKAAYDVFSFTLSDRDFSERNDLKG
jgi:hypothetical protein